MAKEPEFKRGEKGFLKRFVNIFQGDAEIALDDFKENAKNSISEVNNIKTELNDEIERVQETIEELNAKEIELQNKLDKITTFSDSIFEEVDDDGYALADLIESFVQEFKDSKSEIDELKSDIDEYKNVLFGTEDEEGKKLPGLNHKIESLKSQLQETINDSQTKIDAFLSTNNTKKDELFTKIEGLLKGASTVALAKAFKEHKESFDSSNLIWLILFVVSILSMMGLSLWGFINANYEFKDMWKYTLGNLPFIGGAIWLAIYSSKQRSQNKRLQQEYAFKEDVAKVYYGLKVEVEELGDSEIGRKLNDSVLALIIDVVSLNPSISLDSKSHNDNGPIIETLKNIAEVTKNIKKTV